MKNISQNVSLKCFTHSQTHLILTYIPAEAREKDYKLATYATACIVKKHFKLLAFLVHSCILLC